MTIGFHLMLRASDDRVLAPSPSLRRGLADTVLGIGERYGLFVFRAVDTHLHVGAVCDRPAAGRLAHDLSCSLADLLGLRFLPGHIVPIEGQHHLANVFRYVLANAEKHGVGTDAFHDASLLPDLLGLRLRGRAAGLRVRELLPRVTRAELLRIAGVEALAPGFSLDLLPEAVAAAACLPILAGKARRVTDALRAAVRVGVEAETQALAAALGLAPRTIQRLRHEPWDPALERAIRLQMGWRTERGAESTAAPVELRRPGHEHGRAG